MTVLAHRSGDPFLWLFEIGRCLVVSTLESSGARDNVGLIAVVGGEMHRLTSEGATGLHAVGGSLTERAPMLYARTLASGGRPARGCTARRHRRSRSSGPAGPCRRP